MTLFKGQLHFSGALETELIEDGNIVLDENTPSNTRKMLFSKK